MFDTSRPLQHPRKLLTLWAARELVLTPPAPTATGLGGRIALPYSQLVEFEAKARS